MPEVQPLVAVLAAGAGTRFGGAKLDANLAGKPVGQWVLDTVATAGLEPGVIVVPSHAPRFARDSGWPLLPNPHAAQGMGTSLAVAARYALEKRQSMLVVLADMPLVTADHLWALLGADEAATLYPDGRAGVPALIGPALLSELAGLAGAAGAGPLLARQSGLIRVEPAAGSLLDVDQPDDMALAESLLRRASC